MELTNQQKQELLKKVKVTCKLKERLQFDDIVACTIRYNGKQYTGEYMLRHNTGGITVSKALKNFFLIASEIGVTDAYYVHHALGYDDFSEAQMVFKKARKDADGIKRVFGKDLPLYFSLFNMQVPSNL